MTFTEETYRKTENGRVENTLWLMGSNNFCVVWRYLLGLINNNCKNAIINIDNAILEVYIVSKLEKEGK